MPTKEEIVASIQKWKPKALEYGVSLGSFLPGKMTMDHFAAFLDSGEERKLDVCYQVVTDWRLAIVAAYQRGLQSATTASRPQVGGTASTRRPSTEIVNTTMPKPTAVPVQGGTVNALPPVSTPTVEARPTFQGPPQAIAVHTKGFLVNETERTQLTEMEKRELLDAHNRMRAKYGNVPPLVYDEACAQEAQAWANRLGQILGANAGQWLTYVDQSNPSFPHNPKTRYGENIARGSNAKAKMAENVVTAWCEPVEAMAYRRGNANRDAKKWDYVPSGGHFTQVVWKATEKVGGGVFEVTVNQKPHYLLVCNYSPAGNFQGRFADNVTAVL